MTRHIPVAVVAVAVQALLGALHAHPAAAHQGERADTLVLRGMVFDEYSGEPIEAAGLRARKRGARTVTDADGRFSVRVPSGMADTVVISALGYDSIEVALGGEERGTFEIVLRLRRGDDWEALQPPDAFELEGIEVEVEAFAEVRERVEQELANRGVRLDDLGSRFIGPEVIERKSSAQDFGEVIQAAGVPGIELLRPENVQGALATFGDFLCVLLRRTRSGRSVNPRSDCALIVLDGAPVEIGSAGSIPVQPLRSIVILNPLEATLVYGARGAKGVVLLFTQGTVGGSGGQPRPEPVAGEQHVRRPRSSALTHALAAGGLALGLSSRVMGAMRGYNGSTFTERRIS